MSVLKQAHFQDEAAAFKSAGSIIWPDGAVCPYRGIWEIIYVLTAVRAKKNKKHPEGVERDGLKMCGKCLKQLTVRAVFDASRLPLRPWLQAFHLLCSSKKAIGSNHLARVLEVELQIAWFVKHRTREV
jgi:hypothetical protein